MVACFLFRLKNPETKTPHTCLSQPHGGYCLRLVWHSHLAGRRVQRREGELTQFKREPESLTLSGPLMLVTGVTATSRGLFLVFK